jgi:hypothetical protein
MVAVIVVVVVVIIVVVEDAKVMNTQKAQDMVMTLPGLRTV